MNKLKITSIAIFFLITYKSFSQKIINNNLTEKHYKISGTKFAMVLPDEDFVETAEYVGFKNKELETGINITNMTMSYDNVLQMFTKDLPPQNGELLVDEDFIINGFRAKLYKSNTTNSIIDDSFKSIQDSLKTITWILIYGNNDYSFIISSAYKYDLDKVLSQKIKKSLLSFLFLQNEEVNPLEQLSFTLDISQKDLKFASILMQTGVAYTTDGKFPAEVKNKSSYIVMILPFGIEKNKRKQRAIKNIKKPNDNIEINKVSKVSVNGLSGYEIIGYEEKDNKELNLSYGTTLFDDDNQYIIIGKANFELEKNLKDFKSITQSFKLKG